MDQRIDSQHPNFGEQQENSVEKDDQSKPIAFLSEEEMQAVYAKLKIKLYSASSTPMFTSLSMRAAHCRLFPTYLKREMLILIIQNY